MVIDKTKLENFRIFDGNIIKIMTCSNCNVKCKHCYISFKGNFKEYELYDLVTKYAKNYEIRINGTEPLLHKEFLKSIKKAGQTMILTNGLVFKDNYDYIDELKEYGIKTIGISYHFDEHDSISIIPKAYLDNLFNEILKRGMEVQIMTTITSNNYKYIGNYCKYCYDKGINKIRFTNFIIQGNAKLMDKHLMLTDRQREEFFELLDKERKKYSIDVLRIERCGTFGKNIKSYKKFACGAGVDSIVISPDHYAYPCIFLTKPGNEIGFYDKKSKKIYISNEFHNDDKDCLTFLTCNKGKKLF